MITWCPTCWEPQEDLDNHWHRNEMATPYPSYTLAAGPYSITEYFSGYEGLWEARTPRVEFNTVDLKELRKTRQRHRITTCWWDDRWEDDYKQR